MQHKLLIYRWGRVSLTPSLSAHLASEEGAGKSEPSDYDWMGACQRLPWDEALFRGLANPPKPLCHVLRGDSM